MYTYEERMRAVQLYIKYDKSSIAVRRELGYPSRGMLYKWCREFEEGGTLRSDHDLGNSKFTEEQRERAVIYYMELGRSVSRTIKALGFPKRTTLRDWIKKDLPSDENHCVTNKALVRYTQAQKEQAVIRLCARDRTAKAIATELEVSESSLYTWRRRLLSEGCEDNVSRKRSSVTITETMATPENVASLTAVNTAVQDGHLGRRD